MSSTFKKDFLRSVESPLNERGTLGQAKDSNSPDLFVIFIDLVILFIGSLEKFSKDKMKSMSGRKIRETLENELGFEADRARRLPLAFAAEEIDTYWSARKLPLLPAENFVAMAKAGMVAGVAGRQKLSDILLRQVSSLPAETSYDTLTQELSALIAKHQTTINLSRHRTTCVNAHLNILEPDRILTRIYSSMLSEVDLKNYKNRSNSLLKSEIKNSEELNAWINEVHSLLVDITASSRDSVSQDAGDSDIERFKGVISQKAIPTYFKQWESFAREKVGPLFGIIVAEDEVSPLTMILANLEKNKSRSWTTILSDITELKSEPAFARRLNTQNTGTSATLNLINHEMKIKDRPLKIQMSQTGLDKAFIGQFTKAMKAQFVVYSGTGLFSASTEIGSGMITVSLANAMKSDLSKIEEILQQLI
jgi:hypothetical protein